MFKHPLTVAASLIAVAVAVSASTAHAEPPKMLRIQSVRQQIKINAQQQGMWQKGTQLRLQYNPSHTAVTASLWNKSTFNGTPTPLPKAVRMENATAKFKIMPVTEGRIAKPVVQGGRVWQLITR